MTNINQSKFKKATQVFNSVYNKYDIMKTVTSLRYQGADNPTSFIAINAPARAAP